MPKFLTRDELYRLIQRELPEGVYPDGPASGYYATADSDATAQILASIYASLERVYANFFPQDALEKLDAWEIKVFGRIVYGALTPAERREKIIQQLRERLDLSKWTVIAGILEFLPAGTIVQVLENCERFGDEPNMCWKLAKSKLSHGSYLGCTERLLLPNFDEYCDPPFYYWTLARSKLTNSTRLAPTVAQAGVTKLSSTYWHRNQFKAYFYFVNVFNYSLSAEELANIDGFLKSKAIARSAYLIQDNQDPAFWHRTETVLEVDKSDNLDTVYKDGGSSTGYSGRKDTI